MLPSTAAPRPRVAVILRAGEDRELIDANVAFHLRAGADGIVLWAPEEGSRTTIDEIAVDARVRRAPRGANEPELASWAVEELGADWLIRTGSNELWWPRGGSIPNVLGAVPPGVNAAQAITRTLLVSDAGISFAEACTLRLSPRSAAIDQRWRPSRRFAVRSHARDLDPQDLDPLWGYYPFELLVLATGDEAGGGNGAELAHDLHVFVSDTRVRDVLRALRTGTGDGSAFAREGPALALPRLTPAEEAVFALEAAVVDDAELARAREQLDALSSRLAELETSRVLRAEARLRKAVRRRRHQGRERNLGSP